MNIKYVDENWLKEEIKNAIGKHLSTGDYKIFFFGSRVKGNNFERSDIDIGIQGPKPIDAETKLEIEDELDNIPTLYIFDLADFGRTPERFKLLTDKDIEYIN